MANNKKSTAATAKAAQEPKLATEKKAAKSQNAVAKILDEKSSEELLVENFTALSNAVETLSETLDMLVIKAESMAYHIIATEEILAELVAANGLSLPSVNARIRAKFAVGTNNINDASRAIDLAAAIASPLPRC